MNRRFFRATSRDRLSNRFVPNLLNLEERKLLAAPQINDTSVSIQHDYGPIYGNLSALGVTEAPVTFSLASDASNGLVTVNSDG
jgi:hypothetical protein